MTTDEIHDLIQNCDHCGQGGTMHVLAILERINNKVAEIEARLEKTESKARHANNIASCLANGIQPD